MTENIETQAQPKRPRGKLVALIIGIVLAVVLAGGGAVYAVQAIAAAATQSAAQSAYDEAAASVEAAIAAWDSAADDLDKAQGATEDDYTAAKALLAATDAARIDPAEARAELETELAGFPLAAGFKVGDDGVVTFPTTPNRPTAPKPSTGTTPDELNAAASELIDAAASIDTSTAKLTASTAKLTAARAALQEKVDAVVTAAYTKGKATAAPDRASQEYKDAYDASVKALATPKGDVAELVATYVAAWNAAQASHDATIAAEQQAQNGGSGGSGGGGSNGGSGSGGGSNSGGGSGSGGGSDGGGSDGGGCSGYAFPGGCIPWAPIQLETSSVSCWSSGVAGQEVTYGSTLRVPYDAASYNTYEIPGYGWGVSWSCW